VAAVATALEHGGRELDEVTLRLAQRGDRRAQGRFVDHYAPTIFAFLSRRGIGGSVEDAAQDAMVAALAALPRFDPSGTARLSTWLLTIASRSARRSGRRRPTVALADEPADPASTSPEAHAHATQLRDRARAVVDALAPELREAFVLAEAHGLTPIEIGQVQGVPPATARTRLHRARTRIRTALEGDTR
jgi:RNA polymerase sigma-70 factor (ECF subfamily)